MKVICPHCSRRHKDARWWAHRPHSVHHCQYKDCQKTFETKKPCIGD